MAASALMNIARMAAWTAVAGKMITVSLKQEVMPTQQALPKRKAHPKRIAWRRDGPLKLVAIRYKRRITDRERYFGIDWRT